MRQTVAGEQKPLLVDGAQYPLHLFAATRKSIASSSSLIWGEHCSECAMPTCYGTCAFYTPRRDLKCRRFDKGIEAVRAKGVTGGLGLRVSFRKWGKLEAEMRPAVVSREREFSLHFGDAVVDEFLAAAPLTHRLHDGLAIAWTRVKTKVASVGSSAATYDTFLIEGFSETDVDCVFTLTVKPKTSTGRYFQRHFTMKPGYNRVEFAAADIRAVVDLDSRVLVQIEPVETLSDNAFIFTALEFVTFTDSHKASTAVLTAPAPTPARTSETAVLKPAAKVKCVVWDLDNTLWRGTLIEDGFEKLVLNADAVAAIKSLDERGVLNSVVSKNNPNEALDALKRFGLSEYFLAPQIGWGPKSAGMTEIARRLNINKNTFLFVDDQAFERAEVSSAHPDMRVVDDSRIGELTTMPELDLPVTEEARNRRQMYKVEEMRDSAFDEENQSFLDFLKSCDITLTISSLAAANIARVFELSQRTNQLNYAGQATTRKDVDDLLGGFASGKEGLVLSCADKFGDYGIIGFAIVDVQRFHVENFFMSCRVQHKKVDHAFFAWLIERAMARGQNVVSTVFHFSGRNQSAQQVLEEMKFAPTGEDEVFESPRLEELPERDIVTVIDRTGAETKALRLVEN
jgi:FkbH-like protein